MIQNEQKTVKANVDNDLKFRDTMTIKPKKKDGNMQESTEPQGTLEYFTE